MDLVIQLIAGAIGGNLAGGILKSLNLGLFWNSLAGIVGGAIGGQLLGTMGAGGTEIGALLAQVAAGGAGGAALTILVGVIRQMRAR